MKFHTKITAQFECSLERAFKTPMLCDVAKVHTGYLIMPKVTHTTDDANWGQIGSSKKVYVAPSLSQKGGFASMDSVLERIENEYWKIKVDHFQSWMLGFTAFVGEWKTTAITDEKVLVEYSYTLYAKNPFFYPLNWLFTHTFWRVYMRRVLENIRTMAYTDEPYLFK